MTAHLLDVFLHIKIRGGKGEDELGASGMILNIRRHFFREVVGG